MYKRQVCIGVFDAVLTFNDGNFGRVCVLKHLNIEPGKKTVKAFEEIDILRVKRADNDVEDLIKEARKDKRQSGKTEDDDDDDDNPEYAAGMH